MARPLRTVDLTPALWPALERLFGANGACGGCWCMWWRRERGEPWADVKGALARRRMRALVLAGKAHGVLAFDGAEPVGWCAYGPRRDFARLDRSLRPTRSEAAVFLQPHQHRQAFLAGQQVAGGGFTGHGFIAPDAEQVILHLEGQPQVMPEGAVGVLNRLIRAAQQGAQ